MNRIKKLAPYGVGLLAIVGVLAAPQAAQAHDGGVTATCTSLSANLSNYPAGSTIGGTLDGVNLGTSTFGPSFSQTAALDPAVPHTWSITVTSGDGDPRYSFTSAGKSDPSCIPVVEEPPVVTPPVEPPVVVPPVEPPVTEPPVVTPPVEPPVVVPPVVTPPVVTPPVVTPPAAVIAPEVASVCEHRGSTFRLVNTNSTVDVLYTLTGVTTKTYLVPAGANVGTSNYRPKTGEVLTITAADRVWTFVASGGCFPSEQPPVIVPPVVTPPVDVPTTPTTPTTPVDVPTTPVTPATPEAPVAVVTPAPVAPTLVAAAEDTTPVRIAAVDEAPAADTALAYTGTDTLAQGIALAGGLTLLVAGFGALLIARLRRGREVADIVTNRSHD